MQQQLFLSPDKVQQLLILQLLLSPDKLQHYRKPVPRVSGQAHLTQPPTLCNLYAEGDLNRGKLISGMAGEILKGELEQYSVLGQW